MKMEIPKPEQIEMVLNEIQQGQVKCLWIDNKRASLIIYEELANKEKIKPTLPSEFNRSGLERC